MHKDVDEEEDEPEEERPEERLVPVEEVAGAGVPRGWGHGDERGVARGEVVCVGVVGVHHGVVVVVVVVVVAVGDGGGGVGSGRGGQWWSATVVALSGVRVGVGRHDRLEE